MPSHQITCRQYAMWPNNLTSQLPGKAPALSANRDWPIIPKPVIVTVQTKRNRRHFPVFFVVIFAIVSLRGCYLSLVTFIFSNAIRIGLLTLIHETLLRASSTWNYLQPFNMKHHKHNKTPETVKHHSAGQFDNLLCNQLRPRLACNCKQRPKSFRWRTATSHVCDTQTLKLPLLINTGDGAMEN